MPLVAFVVLDAVSLAVASRVNKTTNYKIGLLHGISLSDRKRVPLDGLDGSPDVDDLHTTFDQLICLVWQMVRDARERRFVRLINMYLLNRATNSRLIGCSSTTATDSVIENEDAICAGSILKRD